jgi:hypothetical protein
LPVEIAGLAECEEYYSIPGVVKSLSFSFNRVRQDKSRRSRLFNGAEGTQDEAARELSGLFYLGGASFCLQFGGQVSEVVLLVMTQQGIDLNGWVVTGDHRNSRELVPGG